MVSLQLPSLNTATNVFTAAVISQYSNRCFHCSCQLSIKQSMFSLQLPGLNKATNVFIAAGSSEENQTELNGSLCKQRAHLRVHQNYRDEH
jgi:hypothetical protein